MPVSIHTDDNRSPRSELLSPTSGSSASPHIYQRAPPSLDSQPHSRSRSHSQSRSNSQSQSPPTPQGEVQQRERQHRNHSGHRNGHHRRNGRTAETNGHSNGNNNNNSNGTPSKSWWRSREQELNQSSFTKQELIRMIISAERETTKLHSTLTNTLTLLETESHKAAGLERDALGTFTHLTSLRETAESLAERAAQDLRVAQFELEHKTREVERLKRELESEKNVREELEREVGRAKDAAWKIRRERIMDMAREEGRREGFEKGFIKAQEENAFRMRMRAEAHANANVNAARNAVAGPSGTSGTMSGQRTGPSAAERARRINVETSQAPIQNDPEPEEVDSGNEEAEEPYQELDSLPIVTPPQDVRPFPGSQKEPMKTGYSPTTRPVPRRNNNSIPERGPTPAVDRYAVSIPSQSVIERTTNIGQPKREEPQVAQKDGWVTGAEHSALHGPTPPQPAPLNINAANAHGPAAGPSSAGHSSLQHDISPTSARNQPTSASKPRVKFRRPSLQKTKQTAASWYRSLSFRKKQKPKVLIDPGAEEEGVASASAPVTPADEISPSSISGHGQAPSIRTQVSYGPPPLVVRPNSQRHSKAVSASGASVTSGVRARDYAYPPTLPSQTTPGHKPRAVSIDSASTHISTSQFDLLTAPGAGGTSSGGYPRGTMANTSVGSLNSVSTAGGGKPQSVSGGGGPIGKKLSMIRESPMSRDATPVRATYNEGGGAEPLIPPVRPFAVEGDRRSTRSARSTNSRMVAVNPDPDSSPDWPRGTVAGPGSVTSAQQEQMYPRHPPADSALLRPDSGMAGIGAGGYSVMAPLGTKRSGLSNGSAASGGSGAIDTPTPMPKGVKGKGKERAYMIGEAPGSGNDTSPGIAIAVQTPSDGHHSLNNTKQNANFLSPRQSSTHSFPPSRQAGTSIATSTTKVQDEPPAGQPYPSRSISPIPRSTPKIFQGQGLANASAESVLPFEESKKPKVTVIRRVEGEWTKNNAGMTPGPALFQPLPSRAPEQQRGELGLLNAERGLHRMGSDTSLRSQGSYGKFDSSTYVDPAFWGAPQNEAGVRPVSRGAQSVESRRISYADP